MGSLKTKIREGLQTAIVAREFGRLLTASATVGPVWTELPRATTIPQQLEPTGVVATLNAGRVKSDGVSGSPERRGRPHEMLLQQHSRSSASHQCQLSG